MQPLSYEVYFAAEIFFEEDQQVYKSQIVNLFEFHQQIHVAVRPPPANEPNRPMEVTPNCEVKNIFCCRKNSRIVAASMWQK